jgi:putative SOS response-associated peptidase YedK
MPSDEAPDDDDVRLSYNFAPGYHGLVYRASVSDRGAGPHEEEQEGKDGDGHAEDELPKEAEDAITEENLAETHYKLQAMRWGLIPFWTKRNPDYGSVLRTINCRSESLLDNRGMWTSMKKRKRCIVVCQGFYEWLKKNNGKEKIPHYIKRKDGQLLCFAGLWDCVKYEDSDEKIYTFTIITTDANKQIKFLHDRMPVIFDQGSEVIRTWLDPNRYEWSKELQSLLKPYDGELEIYPVNKEVGKVGNNSPSFIIPLDSKENKSNIANFFGSGKKAAKEEDVKVKKDVDETRGTTTDKKLRENNAPLPKSPVTGVKRERNEAERDAGSQPITHKAPKLSSDQNRSSASPTKSGRKLRSATSNGTVPKSPSKAAQGTQKITKFFGK